MFLACRIVYKSKSATGNPCESTKLDVMSELFCKKMITKTKNQNKLSIWFFFEKEETDGVSQRCLRMAQVLKHQESDRRNLTNTIYCSSRFTCEILIHNYCKRCKYTEFRTLTQLNLVNDRIGIDSHSLSCL